MKNFSITIVAVIISSLSFSQEFTTEFDISEKTRANTQIFDVKEKGVYMFVEESSKTFDYSLIKYNYKLELEWEIELDESSFVNPGLKYLVSKDGNHAFVYQKKSKSIQVKVIDSEGAMSEKKVFSIDKKLELLYTFEGEDCINFVMGYYGDTHKPGTTGEMKWIKIYGDLRMESTTIKVPTPSYTKLVVKYYWKPIGSDGSNVFFISNYINKKTVKTEGIQTELLTISIEKGSTVKSLSKDIYISDIYSKFRALAYTTIYDEATNQIFIQTLNADEKSFSIVSFDEEGEKLWSINKEFIVKPALGISELTRYFASLTSFNNGILAYKFLQPVKNEKGQVYLFSSEDGEMVQEVTFKFEQESGYSIPGISTYFIFMNPDGQAKQEIIDLQNGVSKKRKLKNFSFRYLVEPSYELLILYSPETIIFSRYEE